MTCVMVLDCELAVKCVLSLSPSKPGVSSSMPTNLEHTYTFLHGEADGIADPVVPSLPNIFIENANAS